MSNYTSLNLNVTFNSKNFSMSNTNFNGRFNDSEIIAMQFCHILLGCVGFLENLGVIAVILQNRRMLDFPANWFVLSLAVSDALACVVTPLFVNISIIPDEKPGNLTILFGLVTIASSGNLFMLTFNRFLSVHNPLRYPAYMTTKRAKYFVLVPWVNAFILQGHAYIKKTQNFLGTLYFGLLILSITSFNVYLLKKAREKRKEIRRLEASILGQTAASANKDYRLPIRLTIVSVTFFASCFPLMIFGLLHRRREFRTSISFHRAFLWCVVASELNAIIDPLVYSINHPVFSKYFDKIRNRRLCRNRITPQVFFHKNSEAVDIHF